MAVSIKRIFQSNRLTSNHQSTQVIEHLEQGNVARLVMVITFLLIFIMAARMPLDSDMWWHLRAGKEMLRTGRVLQTDLFTFTRAGTAWTNPYWLAQLGMALLYQWQGFLGLGAAVTLMAVLSMGLVYLQCEGPVFIKAAALLLGSVVASVVWSPRPQILSLVLMAWVGYLLYLYKWRGKDVLWLLPIIFLVWGNVHGGYPLGLMLIGAMIAGEALNHLLGLNGGQVLSWRKIIRLGLFAVAGGIAILINPNGLAMWRLPFLTVDMHVLQQFIPEWASPDFHQVLEQTLLWLLMAVFAAVALSGRRMDGSDLVTLVIFTMMALLAKRNYGPFALAAVPILTRYADTALRGWRERSPWVERAAQFNRSPQPDPAGLRLVKKGINLSLVGLLAFVAFGKLFVVTQPTLVNHYIVQSYPVDGITWLTQHSSGGRVLNEYNWGGYLQRALPGFSTFVDGRTDLFGDEVIGQWINAIQADAGWQNIMDHYQIDWIMLAPDRPLVQALTAAGWQREYQDNQVVIYGRGK